MASTNGAAARLIKAKRREIAIRYRNGKKPLSMAALRCAQLNRIWTARYGAVLPDDDAGRADARIMAHHLAGITGDQRIRVMSWLTVWAPWMSEAEVGPLIEAVLSKPLRWRADKLAELLRLTEAERAQLRITTIGAIDMSKADREIARKARKRQAKREKRRKQGVKPRAEYEAAAVGHGRPWEAASVSKATWYRRQRVAKQ